MLGNDRTDIHKPTPRDQPYKNELTAIIEKAPDRYRHNTIYMIECQYAGSSSK